MKKSKTTKRRKSFLEPITGYYVKTVVDPFRFSPHAGDGVWYDSIEDAKVRAEFLGRDHPEHLWYQLIEVRGGFEKGSQFVAAEYRTGQGWETSWWYGSRTESLIDWDSLEPSLPQSEKHAIIDAAIETKAEEERKAREAELALDRRNRIVYMFTPGIVEYLPRKPHRGYASDPN